MAGAAYVAIPVRNEAAEIVFCLRALAAQRFARLDGVVLCLNNCTDATGALVRAAAPSLPFAVHILEVELPPDLACAGIARRMAMERAVELAGADGMVLTTDADGRAAPGWLAANLDALRAGAEVVAGQADIDPVGAKLIPQHLHDIDARECAYAALLDEIRALVDPDPADPWPRHDEHSGASIAVTTAAYLRAGGMPAAPLGEDREFFAALRRVDARIRHDRAARVVVSARVFGRAPGGMADTIRRRMQVVDALIDDRLESAAAALRRARLRAAVHGLWRGDDGSGQAKKLGGVCHSPQTPRHSLERGPVNDGGSSRESVLRPSRASVLRTSRESVLRKTGSGTSRPAFSQPNSIAQGRALPRLAAMLGMPIDDALRAPYFGQAWAEIERVSPALQRHRVALADLARETARAAWVRDRLRRLNAAVGRDDISFRTAAE